MKLVKYDDIEASQYIEYIEEWESNDERVVPSSSARNGRDFEAIQAGWDWEQSDESYAKGFVPATLYFYTDDQGRIIGAIHLRHELNDRLRHNGGHIGYGVRLSERSKGYATEMLESMLLLLRTKGYDKVLITCDDDNASSAKTIENNGGVLEDKPLFEGVLTRRYWINIEASNA